MKRRHTLWQWLCHWLRFRKAGSRSWYEWHRDESREWLDQHVREIGDGKR